MCRHATIGELRACKRFACDVALQSKRLASARTRGAYLDLTGESPPGDIEFPIAGSLPENILPTDGHSPTTIGASSLRVDHSSDSEGSGNEGIRPVEPVLSEETSRTPPQPVPGTRPEVSTPKPTRRQLRFSSQSEVVAAIEEPPTGAPVPPGVAPAVVSPAPTHGAPEEGPVRGLKRGLTSPQDEIGMPRPNRSRQEAPTEASGREICWSNRVEKQPSEAEAFLSCRIDLSFLNQTELTQLRRSLQRGGILKCYAVKSNDRKGREVDVKKMPPQLRAQYQLAMDKEWQGWLSLDAVEIISPSGAKKVQKSIFRYLRGTTRRRDDERRSSTVRLSRRLGWYCSEILSDDCDRPMRTFERMHLQ